MPQTLFAKSIYTLLIGFVALTCYFAYYPVGVMFGIYFCFLLWRRWRPEVIMTEFDWVDTVPMNRSTIWLDEYCNS